MQDVEIRDTSSCLNYQISCKAERERRESGGAELYKYIGIPVELIGVNLFLLYGLYNGEIAD